ncbi:MAG: PKD domain-containing protein [Cellvibrionaceae bacterium]
MFTLRASTTKLAVVLGLPFYLVGCSQGGSDSESADSLGRDTAFAFVERSISEGAANGLSLFQEKLQSESESPQDLTSPYAFNPGAKLVHRSSLDVDAEQWNVLGSYFGSAAFDVKDLNVSRDGTRMLLAARGPANHPHDYTWNIYEYVFETREIRRVIANDAEANAGQDTNPTYTLDGRIVFSSDRAAGNPNHSDDGTGDAGTDDQQDEDCFKIGPAEKPSLLHLMSAQGEGILQLTFGNNHDTKTTTLTDGNVAFVRWSRSYDLLPQCDAETSTAKSSVTTFGATYPSGLDSPSPWSDEQLCSYAVSTPLGKALPSNHYTLLSISPDTEQLEQVYETVTIFGSDEEFVFLDKIVQGQDGYLIGLMKHFYNQHLGGNVVTLRDPASASEQTIFSNVAPRALGSGETNLYPNQLSSRGWSSAVTPYKDGTSRLLVSWSQCTMEQGGVNAFCDQGGQGSVSSQYGIWVYDPQTDSRLPVVEARRDVVYTELAMAQIQSGQGLPFAPVNPEFVDNLDESRLICDDPSDIPPTEPEDPVEPTDPNDPDDPNDPSDPSDPTDPTNPGDPGDPNDPSDPNDPDDPTDPSDPTDPNDPANQAPIANAGADQEASVRDSVMLDGSLSNDPDGQPAELTFLWRFAVLPIESTLDDNAIQGATTVSPTFVPDIRGSFALELEVSDGAATATDSVEILIGNNNPVADAGPDQNVAAGLAVTLDGSGSFDPDRDRLGYLWSFQDISPSSALTNADIVGRNTPNPSFVPDEAVVYPIKADFVFIIDGSASMQDEIDVVRDGLRVFVENLTDPASEIDARFAVVTFEERPLGSVLPVVRLGFTESTTVADVASEVIAAFDAIDTSYIGPVQREAGLEAIRFVLADPTLVAEPPVGLEFRADARKNLILATDEDSDGPYNNGDFEPPEDLTDGSPDAQWQDEIDRTAALLVDNSAFVDLLMEPADRPSTDQYGNPEADRLHAGSERFDPEATLAALEDPASGNPHSLQAQVLRAGLIARSYAVTAANDPIFVDSFFNSKISETIENPLLGTYTLSLVVNDGELDSPADTVSVRAFFNNAPPNALAGPDQTAQVGAVVQLDGSASFDSDGGPLALSFQWRLVEKPGSSALTDAEINGANSAIASFVPDVSGQYTLELTVSDGANGGDDTDRIAISVSSVDVEPNADAGANHTQADCELVAVNGSASFDPDGMPEALSYRWSFVSLPSGSALLSGDIQNRNQAGASFSPDRFGSYVLELEVDDGEFSDIDHVLVVIGDDPGLSGDACTP